MMRLYTTGFPHSHPFPAARQYARTSLSSRTNQQVVIEDDPDSTSVKLTIELPGVKATDIDLVLNDGVLSLTATKQIITKAVRKKYRIERTFSLDTASVDASKPIEANLSRGVLTVTIFKVAKAPPIKITVTENEEAAAHPSIHEEDVIDVDAPAAQEKEATTDDKRNDRTSSGDEDEEKRVPMGEEANRKQAQTMYPEEQSSN